MSLPIFTFENISFIYPKSTQAVLNSVSFSVTEGETFALLGPNGAGKTTLLRLLCGRLHLSVGKIDIADDLKSEKGLLDLSKCGILLENPGIYSKLSILEYLEFFAEFYSVKDAYDRILKLAKFLDVFDVSQKLGTLSQGTKQKVQIIRALLHRPKVLLLDEPVANLDPISRSAVWSLLGDWKKEMDGTILVSSHILSEMDKYADSFAVISNGKLLKKVKKVNLQTSDVLIRVKRTDEFKCDSFDSLTLQKRLDESNIPLKILSVENARIPLEKIYKDTLDGMYSE